jgi:hypothetical protein
MLKVTRLVFCLISAIWILTPGVQAGDAAGSRPASGLLNENNLTATGETVPHPGVSQSGGTTELDIAIQRKDDRVERSICSNC